MLLIPGILADHHIEVNYKIYDSTILTTINLDSPKNLEIVLPYDYKSLEISEDYLLNKNILLLNSDTKVSIKYVTNANLDKAGNKFYFAVKNQYPDLKDITLYLPEGAILSEKQLIFPENYEISTDGRRIILFWNNTNKDILVFYEYLNKNNYTLYSLIIFLILIIGVSYFYLTRKYKKQLKKIKQRSKGTSKSKEQELTNNLLEEEKQIVKYLLTKKKNEAWTKDIIKGTGISKVKLSRKLRSLESKEIIKKIPYGNENKIKVLR